MLLKLTPKTKSYKNMMKDFDKDGYNKIDFDEFINMMIPKTSDK